MKQFPGSEPRRRARRGLSLLEVMVAVLLLAVTFLGWDAWMIAATDAENKASNHTQAIAIANYLLEYMRNDPYMFTNSEQAGTCTTSTVGNCWTSQNLNNKDSNGNILPAYDDTTAITASNTHDANWINANTHVGFNNSFQTYRYLWRADIHGQGKPFSAGDPTTYDSDASLADLTVWVFVNTDGRLDAYEVIGARRENICDKGDVNCTAN